MKQSKTLETIVGLFVAAGAAALFLLAMKVSNLSTAVQKGGYAVTARFENIGGLKVRSPVKMSGVPVGRVVSIGFDDKIYEAVVEMAIEPQFTRIPTDTTASILTSGLLGEQYVGLDPGAEEKFLKNGDMITITQSSVILEKLIGQFLFMKAGGEDKK
jgi:phospholipid/cholesterol/gamma-HCH transport system substrate-binding protein